MRVNSLSPSLLSFFMILQSSKSSILWCHIRNYRPFQGVIMVRRRGRTTQALHCRETVWSDVENAVLSEKPVQVRIFRGVIGLHDCNFFFSKVRKRCKRKMKGNVEEWNDLYKFLFGVEKKERFGFRWFGLCLFVLKGFSYHSFFFFYWSFDLTCYVVFV